MIVVKYLLNNKVSNTILYAPKNVLYFIIIWTIYKKIE